MNIKDSDRCDKKERRKFYQRDNLLEFIILSHMFTQENGKTKYIRKKYKKFTFVIYNKVYKGRAK